MHTEKVDAQDSLGATALLGAGLSEQLSVTGRYDVKCLDADGNLKWEDSIENLVVTVGKANLLNVYLASGTQTTTWYLGLVDGASTPTYNVGDTMLSHAGWTESVAYSNATRPTGTFATTATSSISTSATTFTINATATIAGVFLTTISTKSGTTGTLYSAGSFATSRAVISGDSLLVTYTASV
jgi:hypothetical protein